VVTIRWQEQITQQLSTKTHVAVNLIVLFFFKKRIMDAKFAITKGLQTHDIITSSSTLVA
jgi:hypothetical protein